MYEEACIFYYQQWLASYMVQVIFSLLHQKERQLMLGEKPRGELFLVLNVNTHAYKQKLKHNEDSSF